MGKQLAGLKEEHSKVGRDFGQLGITAIVLRSDERTRTQEIIGGMAETGVKRVVEVSAIEPLFFVGDYRAKLDRLAKIAL